MAAAAATSPLRRQEAPDLDHRWGWGRDDPQTGQPLYIGFRV